MSVYDYPLVGFGVIIEKNHGEVLLGLRQGSHGSGEWCFPGGKLEKGETLFESVRREVKEEVGIEVSELKIISLADEMRYLKTDGRQFFNIGVLAKKWKGEVSLMEPDKYKEWRWFSKANVPENLLEGTSLILKNYKNGVLYKS